MRKRLKQWRSRFYAGPRFLGIEPYRRNGYQSPTLTTILWAYALVVRHLTLPARIIFICAGLIMLYAMFSLDMPIHLLAFSILALFAWDFIIGFLFRPRLQVERRLPERIGIGSERAVEYRITNQAKRTLWDINLDTLPFPNHVRFARGRSFIRELKSGESMSAQAPISAGKRGRYRLPAMRADSAYPFNLWRWGVTTEGPGTLVVYPAFTPLRELDLETGVRYQAGGIALSSRVGESMEFLGCREYRSGDNPRLIHWRSWARTSFPVMKEFCEEYLCRTALIVDTFRPRRRRMHWGWYPAEDEVLEAGVSLSAAIAEHLSHHDYIMDLFAAGPEVYRFQGGRSLGYLDNILDILACLSGNPHDSFKEFSAELVSEIARISSAVFVLLTWNELRAEIIRQMTVAGITVKVLLISDMDQHKNELPSLVRVLSAADIRNGRCTTL